MKSSCESKEVKTGRIIELPVLAGSPTPKSAVRSSKAAKWRAVSLVTLSLLMIAHVIQWWIAGSTVSPIEPSESMFTLQSGAVNAGFIFFSLAILGTLAFGRFVCGWGCHIVALQDFCAWLLKKMGLTPRPFRSRLLAFVPLIVALYMFVWPTVLRVIAASDEHAPVVPPFTNHIITTEFWATFPPVAVAIPFLFICGFMTVYFLGAKGFCTYACPYGGFFGIADRFAPGKIRVTDACNECGHCTAVCTSNVLVHAEVKQYGMVVDPGCMKCMDCVSVCPNDALYFGFGKPAVLVGTGSGSDRASSIKKNYSLTWPEEILAAAVFAASYFAVWDVYQLVPMLMALGVACVTTFLVMRTIKLFRSRDLSFYRFNLRSSDKIKTAGWVFTGLALLWTGLNAHSGWVRYHEAAGAKAFQSLQVPDELALAQANPDGWLSQSDRQYVAEGKEHFRDAVDRGLFINKDAISKYAWMEYLSGDTEEALRLLAKAASHQEGPSRAISLYYRGSILNRLGRYDQAITDLDAALAERPDLAFAPEEKGESLWMLGRKEEAIAVWKATVERNPELPLANNLLSAAMAAQNNIEAADAYMRQADVNTPEDPKYQWMLGLRLQNVGMNRLAERHFQQAVQLDSSFILRRRK